MITKVKASNSPLYQDLFARATEVLRTHTVNGELVEEFPDGSISDNPAFGEGDMISNLNGYFANIRKLAQVDLIYTKLPLDEEPFEIDADSRVIKVPSDFQKNGISVQGDEIAEVVYFKIDRYYDATDLATQNIAIQWVNADGVQGLSKPVLVDTQSELGYLIFGWALSSEITEKAGNIKFAVRFYTLEEDTIRYSLSTLEATASIKPSLNLDLRKLTLIDKSADIRERLKDSIYDDDSDVTAGSPEFKINLDETIDLDEAGIAIIKVAAISPDAGQIGYEWYKLGTDGAVPADEEKATFKYEITKDESRDTSKVYYRKVEINGEEKYVLFTQFDSNFPHPEINGEEVDIYEKLLN